MMPRKPHLLLCLTPGIGLARWKSVGSLERELKPYVEYVERGWDVTLATCDRPSEIPELPAGIGTVCCPAGRLLPLAPWFLRSALRRADVVKTNQSGGSWWYVAAAKLHRKPILLRCGWLPGSYLETRDGLGPRLRVHRILEGWAFRQADACMVATEADRDWVIRHYRAPAGRVHLRPNFVDTRLFSPGACGAGAAPLKPRSVVFVGRLDAVKNAALLIEACVAARASELCLVGDGPQRAALEGLAARIQAPVRFAGAQAQADLPALLRQHEVFALPSRVEGHPKALFEAMACGMPCVGANVPGIATAIRDGETGLLCEPRAAALASSLDRLFDGEALRRRLGSAARRFVEETLSFETIMDSEIRHVRSLLRGPAAQLDPKPMSQAI